MWLRKFTQKLINFIPSQECILPANLISFTFDLVPPLLRRGKTTLLGWAGLSRAVTSGGGLFKWRRKQFSGIFKRFCLAPQSVWPRISSRHPQPPFTRSRIVTTWTTMAFADPLSSLCLSPSYTVVYLRGRKDNARKNMFTLIDIPLDTWMAPYALGKCGGGGFTGCERW